MLAALDEGLGNLTATLRDTKRWTSTLFVLTSDNGAPTPGCGGAQGGQNWPLRGGKCSAWSGGNLVPSFIHGPGVRKGGTLDDLAHAVDWGTTILSFVRNANNNTDGNSGNDGNEGGIDNEMSSNGGDGGGFNGSGGANSIRGVGGRTSGSDSFPLDGVDHRAALTAAPTTGSQIPPPPPARAYVLLEADPYVEERRGREERKRGEE